MCPSTIWVWCTLIIMKISAGQSIGTTDWHTRHTIDTLATLNTVTVTLDTLIDACILDTITIDVL